MQGGRWGEMRSVGKRWLDCIDCIVHYGFLLWLRWETVGRFEQSSDMI